MIFRPRVEGTIIWKAVSVSFLLLPELCTWRGLNCWDRQGGKEITSLIFTKIMICYLFSYLQRWSVWNAVKVIRLGWKILPRWRILFISLAGCLVELIFKKHVGFLGSSLRYLNSSSCGISFWCSRHWQERWSASRQTRRQWKKQQWQWCLGWTLSSHTVFPCTTSLLLQDTCTQLYPHGQCRFRHSDTQPLSRHCGRSRWGLGWST